MEKKDVIYKAAIKVISQNGFDDTKMQMIAEEAQIAVGTIYLYFQSKEEILGYIIYLEHLKRIDYLEQLTKCEKPAFEKIRDFLQYNLDTLIRDHGEGRILDQEIAQLGVLSYDNVRNSINSIHKELCKIIEEAQEQSSVRKANPLLLASILINSVKGFATSLVHENNNEKDYPELEKQAISFMMNGIKN